MARQSHKVKRHTFSLNHYEEAMLDTLMREDGKTEVSSYIGTLLTEITRRRAEEKPKAIGRPRKDKDVEEDEPRTIPNPNPMDAKARPFLTPSEYEGYLQLRGEQS